MIYERRFHIILVSFAIFINLASFQCVLNMAIAGNGHEDCLMCHSVHTAKDIFLFPEIIKTGINNPHTNKDMDKIDLLCMMCHAQKPLGEGIREIAPEEKHPYGINPSLVKLPKEAKGFGEEKEHLSCLGCHNPHPSNLNLAYLRTPDDIEVYKEDDVFSFCIWCHPNMELWLGVIPKPAPKSLMKKIIKREKPLKPEKTNPLSGGIDYEP